MTAREAAASVFTIITSYALAWTGFNEEAVRQTAETLFRPRLVFAFGGLFPVLLGLSFLLVYPLSEKRVRELREMLDRRPHSSP